MIVLEPFIWREDHYSYHITNTEAMEGICKNGLKPLVGDRSKSIGDNIKGIFFFDSLYLINDWIERLYKDKDIKVAQDKIEYLRLYDKETDTFLPLNFEYYLNDSDNRIMWNSLRDYKPLVKSKNIMEGEQLTLNL